LVCSGLDHAHRGFETFARECFTALREDPRVRIELVKGSGAPGQGERSLPTPTRDSRFLRALARLLGKQSFRLEAFVFGVELVPLVLEQRPDLVYTSEWDTSRVLAWVRDRTRARFKILLSNGSFASVGFEHLDHVQELTPAALDYVLRLGADPARHTVLPLGFQIEPQLSLADPVERNALRARQGLPADRRIVVSVAALNRSHKRIDYLIEEIAAVPEPRPFLLLVGEPEPETPGLVELARDRLGEGHYAFRTVPAERVPELLRASDLFVLASLAEMQGRALIEAAAAGVECIAHENPVMRFALGEHGIFGDLSRTGALTRLLVAHQRGEFGSIRDRCLAAHRHVYERFSWDCLRSRYIDVFTTLARDDGPADPGDSQRALTSSPHSEPTTRAL
jgi:1,2-diacylglycerol 3-alpha-glucosyltransferase